MYKRNRVSNGHSIATHKSVINKRIFSEHSIQLQSRTWKRKPSQRPSEASVKMDAGGQPRQSSFRHAGSEWPTRHLSQDYVSVGDVGSEFAEEAGEAADDLKSLTAIGCWCSPWCWRCCCWLLTCSGVPQRLLFPSRLSMEKGFSRRLSSRPLTDRSMLLLCTSSSRLEFRAAGAGVVLACWPSDLVVPLRPTSSRRRSSRLKPQWWMPCWWFSWRLPPLFGPDSCPAIAARWLLLSDEEEERTRG